MSDIFFKLSAAQRLDMQIKGYSPFNEADVQRYMNGQKPEHNNYIAEVTGAKVKKNLGSAREREEIAETGRVIDDNSMQQRASVVNYREQAMQEMDNYDVSSGINDLRLSSKPITNQRTQQSMSQRPVQNKLTKIQEAGYKLTENYIAAFKASLTQPNNQTRQAVIDAMKKLIEAEKRCSENKQILLEFRQGNKLAERNIL